MEHMILIENQKNSGYVKSNIKMDWFFNRNQFLWKLLKICDFFEGRNTLGIPIRDWFLQPAFSHRQGRDTPVCSGVWFTLSNSTSAKASVQFFFQLSWTGKSFFRPTTFFQCTLSCHLTSTTSPFHIHSFENPLWFLQKSLSFLRGALENLFVLTTLITKTDFHWTLP